MPWEWLLDNIWVVVVTVVLAALGIGATIWGVIYTLRRGERANRQMREEIKKLQEQNTQMQFYLDGIPEVRDRRKAVIYRDAFRAMREYQHEEAIAKFQELLPLAANDSERCAILNLIGLSQGKSGATRDAEKTFLEVIRIAEQAKVEEALAVAYGNIGVVNLILGEPRKALEYHQKALKIDEKTGSLEGQAIQLGNIGIVYATLGELQKALEYFGKSLEIHKKIGSLEGQANQLGNIGLVYHTLGESHKALEYHQKALKIDEKIGSLEGQAQDLGNIGLVYQTLGEPQKALEYYGKALAIDEKIGNLEGQAFQLGNIGGVYFNSGDYKQALDYAQRAREIFVKIGAKLEIEKVDQNIALAREKLAEQEK